MVIEYIMYCNNLGSSANWAHQMCVSMKWNQLVEVRIVLIQCTYGVVKGAALYLVPTDKHCPEKKLLVDDVASSSFRFKLSRDVFFQWKFKGEGFGFQFKSRDVAKQFLCLLEEIKTSHQVRYVNWTFTYQPNYLDTFGQIVILFNFVKE